MSEFIQQEPITLASASPNRLQLLASTGLDFTIHPADIDEQAIKESNPEDTPIQIAKRLAEKKAMVVSEQYPMSYIIAADQLCHCQGQRFDKPLTHEKAFQQLQQLQGQSHQQICAMAIAYQGTILWSEQDIATLTMKSLPADSLDAYLKLDKPYHSCGAYHFETAGKWLFESVDGSESSIQGLALLPLLKALYELQIVKLTLPNP